MLAFDAAFTGKSAWSAPWMRRYAKSIGVDHDLLGSLILATWARSSASLIARLLPNARTLRISAEQVTARKMDLASLFASDRDFALWRHAVKRFRHLLV